MHSEWCSIDEQAAEKIARAKREGRRIIAVGTTSLRTLESAAQRIGLEANRTNAPASSPRKVLANELAGQWDTNLFITPGYEFKLVDGLVTNFHLPKSTLLMLISALIGYNRIQQAYQHAIAQRYRFFSYGDACLFI